MNDYNMTLLLNPDETANQDSYTSDYFSKCGELRVVNIDELKHSQYNPFAVSDDKDMEDLMASIEEVGVVNPCIAFINEYGEIELVSGNRRKHACEKLGISDIPVVIKRITRDEANIIVGISNLITREKIKLSEKGKAYRLIREARAHQGKRVSDSGINDITRKAMSEMAGESYDTICRLIRLTYLIEELQNLVDENKLSLKAAVELSYISSFELQRLIYEYIVQNNIKMSVSQAKKLKELDKNSNLDETNIPEVFDESDRGKKKNTVNGLNPNTEICLSKEFCYKYFPDCKTTEEVERAIEELIDIVNEYNSRLIGNKEAAV